MPTTTGHLKTPNASKYLQQLCKHFSHKIEVSFDETQGTAAFEMGTAHMTADATELTVVCTVQDAAAIPVVHHVIDSHLEKFAFREGIEAMAWTTIP